MNSRMIRSLALVAALSTLFGCATTKAPKPPATIVKGDYSYLIEHMKWYVQKEMKSKNIVGLSVALVDDQQIIWQEGFGYADKKQKLKATPATRYRAGSISKVFNAMAVMKLSEMGKLDIDNPLVTYLPEFSVKSRFGNTDGITPRSIMTHHSGLAGDWVDGMFAEEPLHYTKHVKKIQNEYVAYPSNTIFGYSNLAVTLLGDAVEKTSGETYADFMQNQLLDPLGMNDSDFEMALSGPGASKSYAGGKETVEYPIGEVPAGALNTTVEDLSQLIKRANSKEKETVLQNETLNEMFRVQNANIALDLGEQIGLGWFIDTQVLSGSEPVYGHDGGTIAHRSSFAVAPESKLGVVVLSNTDAANSRKIANELLQKAWEAKTGNKLSFEKVTVGNISNFEGTYATLYGKANTVKKSDDFYIVKTSLGKFNLKRHKDNNTYHLKYRLFGFIPIGGEDSRELALYTQEIDGHHLIVGEMDGHKFIAGQKVEPTEIPKAWIEYLGHYKIINQLEPENFQIKNQELKLIGDYLVLQTTVNTGEKVVQILRAVSDTEAITEGLGRGFRESVRMEGDILNFKGLRFEKISRP